MSASTRYVLADLTRNPRRTLSTMIGVILGVGLFCAVLFFVDGLSASMTQRAVAPLSIDMQRIVTQRPGVALALTQTIQPSDTTAINTTLAPNTDDPVFDVTLELRHNGHTTANEVTIRSVPAPGFDYVDGSATVDGRAVADPDGNPFATGAAQQGHNIGSIDPETTHRLVYRVTGSLETTTTTPEVTSTYSSRESVSPIGADQPPRANLQDVATQIATLPGIDRAVPLSIADLGSDTLSIGTPNTDRRLPGATKIFGFDDAYLGDEPSIVIVDGALSTDGAVISAEVARGLQIGVGDIITVDLPDDTSVDFTVTGVTDLSEARALFSSRRGGDLETFIYVPLSVIVSAQTFADEIFPAYERAASGGDGRLKNPPIREIDIGVAADLLDADPATAVTQTERISSSVIQISPGQDYLLDNITNTLRVAADDAQVAKRLFVFLGVPGALLAAMLAAYAGNVLAEGQRREQAILRIRGANRRHLLRLLTIRTALLATVGAIIGLATGYLAALAVLGAESLQRASTASLATSALAGTLGGFTATGVALYLTGRRSIDREIHDDRHRLSDEQPLWRRVRLDLVGLTILVGGTAWALRTNAFDGTPGSVYFGRAVELNLTLLILPIAVWITGSLIAGRLIGSLLGHTGPASASHLSSATPALARRSIGRRPWAISNAAVVATLIVGLATSLGAFTASYDQAKTSDARYANGADIRITPSPSSDHTYTADEASVFTSDTIAESTPVIYSLSNVILRSDRTSDPGNLVALDPTTFAAISPVDAPTADQLRALSSSDSTSANTVLVSVDMADSLQAEPGDTLHVLLARATPEQSEIEVTIAGLFERLPGFPDGADAVLHLDHHLAAVPTKHPDFFLASTIDERAATLDAAVAQLRADVTSSEAVHIDTRISTLDRDQSSLAALNIAGLIHLDSAFSLAMATATIAIFVFGLLLQRRREYIVLRAQGLDPSTIRGLIAAEAATVAITGIGAGVIVGTAMGYYFVAVLRPLFVLDPAFRLPLSAVAPPVVLVVAATIIATFAGSRMIATLQPTELLRDE